MEELNQETVLNPTGDTPTISPIKPETPKPAGSLFDSITYQRPEDVTIWLERMNVQDGVFALISAAAYGHKKGVYNLLESEIVSKAIRLITTQRVPPPPSMSQAPPVPSEAPQKGPEGVYSDVPVPPYVPMQ